MIPTLAVAVLALTAPPGPPAAAPPGSGPGSTPAEAPPTPAASVPAPPAEVAELIRALGGGSVERSRATQELIARGREVTPHLLPLLDDPRWTVRWCASNVLGSIRDPRGIPALVARLLVEEDQHTRWRVLWAIAEADREAPAAAVLLARELATEQPVRRFRAALGLAQLHDPRAIPILHEHLSAPTGWQRFEALSSLELVHDASTSARVEPRLGDDEEERVRQQAVQLLGSLCDGVSLRLLGQALEDRSGVVRARAAIAVGRCGDASLKPALEKALERETNARARGQLESALAQLGSKRSKRP